MNLLKKQVMREHRPMMASDPAQASETQSQLDGQLEIGYESSKRAYMYISLIAAACPALWLPVALSVSTFNNVNVIAALSIVIAISLGLAVYYGFFAKPPIRLTIGKEGMSFAGAWQIELLARMTRGWKDVHSIYLNGFQGGSQVSQIGWESVDYWTATPQMQIIYKSGGSAHIKLPLLTKEQATQVVEAITYHADPSRLAADVVKLKEALLADGSDVSFTQLWSEDLELRHASTHFVPLSPNSRIRDGGIRVIREIATGGLSAIYLAEDHHKRKVVLKESVLPLDMKEESKEKARDLFRREAKLLMKLDHPQIAQVYDQFIEQGRDYLVLQYIPGRSLRQLVSVMGPQPASKVIDYITQAATILQYLHGQSPPVVHRDVTPDNLVLREDGRLVMIDFGAANEYVGSATGTMIGKQAYIPPEQFRGKAQPQSDLYSLGATAYYLLTGKDPIPLAASDPKEHRPEVSQSLAELVRLCTEPEVEDRINSAAEVIARLRDLDDTSSSEGHRMSIQTMQKQ